MRSALLLVVALASSGALAAEPLARFGAIRGDYWANVRALELNFELSALPYVDVELGALLPPRAGFVHLAIGPRLEVRSRKSETGLTMKIPILVGTWADLSAPTRLGGVSLTPGFQATYWFARNLGLTGIFSVRVMFRPHDGSFDYGPVLAVSRLGVGIAF